MENPCLSGITGGMITLPLKITFHEMFAFSKEKESSIKDTWDERIKDWDLNPRRQLNDREQEQWRDIKINLPSFLNQHDRNTPLWKLNSNQCFSVRSVKSTLNAHQSAHPHNTDQ